MYRSAESFIEAKKERLKVSGNPKQYDDLNLFVKEQEIMKNLVGKCKLPVLEIDISDNNISRAVETIADWMEATGGLYAKY